MSYVSGGEVAVRQTVAQRRRASARHLYASLRAARPALADGFEVHIMVATRTGGRESVTRIVVDEQVNRLIVVALGGQGLRGLDDSPCRRACHELGAALDAAHHRCGPDMRAMTAQGGLPDAAYSEALTALAFLTEATSRFPLGSVAVVDVSGAG